MRQIPTQIKVSLIETQVSQRRDIKLKLYKVKKRQFSLTQMTAKMMKGWIKKKELRL